MSKLLYDLTEALVSEGYRIPIDLAADLMCSGYIVEGLEDRAIDGFQVINDVVQQYEDLYE